MRAAIQIVSRSYKSKTRVNNERILDEGLFSHQKRVAQVRGPLPHSLVSLVQHVRLQNLRLAQLTKAKALSKLSLQKTDIFVNLIYLGVLL